MISLVHVEIHGHKTIDVIALGYLLLDSFVIYLASSFVMVQVDAFCAFPGVSRTYS